MGKMGSGKISFNGCFHDMPWGLQTHIYAPMNIDMRNRYRVQGNQPGLEAPEATEIGLEELGAPKDGLYLREDIEIKCNITMMSFVKAEMKKASKEMVGRMIKKAELLDAGVLKAMFQDGRLKTLNPADRSDANAALLRQSTIRSNEPYSPGPGPASPNLAYQHPQQSPQFPQYSRPGTGSSQGNYHNPYAPHPTQPPQNLAPPLPSKMQGQYQGQYQGQGQGQSFAMELPGDYYHANASRSPSLHQSQPSPGYRNSVNSIGSQHSPDPRYSNPQPSPGLYPGYHNQAPGHPQSFAAELPAPLETREEHQHDRKY
ncbi:hypothetical protein B0T10DRAFT_479155 [Thelonectria olida]|uniref:DUF7053 domain-containing protein n=1 Tax=Thelonectria olida TaxID=1576542 RepID=A0A9P8WF19_9HYPO|nr:hypothetical protein B0T10DRAFT_479155 [Thelonectria olida]